MRVRRGTEALSVSITVTLPAQPTQGLTEFVTLGGNGKNAPLGCYFARAEVIGDVSGGTAEVTINMDTRYTNLIAFLNPTIGADAAAGAMALRIGPNRNVAARAQVVGTIPNIATGTVGDNSVFLWYPPPLYFQGDGAATFFAPNVGVLETYKLGIEVYCFDINVKNLAPLPLLQLNVPGVSAPAAV